MLFTNFVSPDFLPLKRFRNKEGEGEGERERERGRGGNHSPGSNRAVAILGNELTSIDCLLRDIL